MKISTNKGWNDCLTDEITVICNVCNFSIKRKWGKEETEDILKYFHEDNCIPKDDYHKCKKCSNLEISHNGIGADC